MSFYLGAWLYLILRGSSGPTIEDAARPPWPTLVCLLQRRVDRKKHTSQRNSWFKQRLNVNTHTYIRIFLDLSNVSKQVFVTCCLPQTRKLRKVNISSIKLLINDIWGIDRFIVWSCPRVVKHSHLENKADLERRGFSRSSSDRKRVLELNWIEWHLTDGTMSGGSKALFLWQKAT